MNNPASSGGPVVALALTPPDIPSKTYPIIHPAADVGLSRLNYYADPLGLLVLFGPYWGQLPNEDGRMLINGSPAPVPVQVTKDTTSPLAFRVPPGLLSNGVNILKVNLKRQSGNEDSAELSVLYSLDDPAGNDTDPNPGNSLLNIDVTPKSIGPVEAVAGVKLTMSWPGMALYDLLTINYGGKTLTHQLVPTAQDPNPETKPVVLTFNTADFAHAPNNPQFIFKYNVKSQIDDFSGTSPYGVFIPQKLWSKDCVGNVHLDWVELLEAILQEILGDNNDNPAIADLGKMNGGPLWALIHLIPSIWQTGDLIHLMFKAWLNGAMVATHDETFPIGNVPGQFSWPIPNVKVVANSQVQVKFEHIRAGKVIGISKTAIADVVGQTSIPRSEDFDSVVPFTNSTPGTRQLNNMTITATALSTPGGTHWGVTPVPPGFLVPGQIDGQIFSTNNARIEFNFGTSCSEVSFYYMQSDFGDNLVEALDENGTVLESKHMKINPNEADKMTFSSSGILKLILTPPRSELLLLDRFEWIAH